MQTAVHHVYCDKILRFLCRFVVITMFMPIDWTFHELLSRRACYVWPPSIPCNVRQCQHKYIFEYIRFNDTVLHCLKCNIFSKDAQWFLAALRWVLSKYFCSSITYLSADVGCIWGLYMHYYICQNLYQIRVCCLHLCKSQCWWICQLIWLISTGLKVCNLVAPCWPPPARSSLLFAISVIWTLVDAIFGSCRGFLFL